MPKLINSPIHEDENIKYNYIGRTIKTKCPKCKKELYSDTYKNIVCFYCNITYDYEDYKKTPRKFTPLLKEVKL